MSVFQENRWAQGFIIIGLNAWAALTFALMLVKSYMAENPRWISVLSGLIFVSTAVSVQVWRSLVLDKEEVEESYGKGQ